MGLNLPASNLTANVKRTQLSNQLTVLTKEVHTQPIVAAMIWYRVGSRDEELGQTGKSHFLEHMLFKGTDRYQKGAIDLLTTQNGGRNNAFTWLDFTAYYFTFASDRWELALEIEASRMRHNQFAQEEFLAEKHVVIEELQIGQDGPWDALEEEVWAAAFRQHPYHNPTVGWIEDLLSVNAEDMKAYYDKWYHPRNATIVLVGDFETDKVLARIEQLFGGIAAGPENQRTRIVEPAQRGEKRVVVKRATPVERLMIGYHAPDLSSSDTYALQVFNMIISAGRRSRLYQKLQEEDRSVTFATASYHDHIDPSLFYFQAEVKPGHELATVEKSILQVIEDLKQQPVSAAELAKAKRQIKSQFVLGNEDLLSQAILLGQFETIAIHDNLPADARGYQYLSNFLTQIEEVTAADVQRVAQQYFIEKNRTVGYLVNDPSAAATSGSDLDGLLVGEIGDMPVAADVSEAVSRSAPMARENVGQSSPVTNHPVTSSSTLLNQDHTKLGALARQVSFRRDEWLGTSGGLWPASTDNINGNDAGFDKVPNHHQSWAKAVKMHGAKASAASTFAANIERVKLDNGITLLLGENHNIPAVSINAVVHAGSRYETNAEAGLVGLLGDLLDEGTTTRTSQEIAESIEQVGGVLQTFGGYSQSGISTTVLTGDLTLGLDLTVDVLCQATIPDDRFAQQLDRRLAQIQSRDDDPRLVASDTFNEIVYPGHPAHRPKLGYAETLAKLTPAALREFYQRYFAPQNTLIAIVGDIDKAQVAATVAEKFATWKTSSPLNYPTIPTVNRQTTAIDRYIYKDKEQINVYIGHLGITRTNPDYYALMVLDTILGSSPGFTSRIPRILRDEQGLAYSTFSNITGSAGMDPGRFVAYIGTSPENLEKAVTGIKTEIRRITVEPVTVAELQNARDYLTGSFVFHFETNAQLASFLIEAELYQLGFDYVGYYPEKIRAITVEDVHRVAQQYLAPDCLTTVIVGPVDETGKIVKKTRA
jgi:zinc protease